MLSESHNTALNPPLGVYSLQPAADIDIIVVSGADASRFLQGQLTCNLDHLTSERSLRGALCNLKGRAIANMRLLASDTEILMQTPTGMGQVIIDTLKKYQVFFKVDLQLTSDRFVLLQVALDPSRLPQDALPLALPGQPDASNWLEGIHITRLPELQTSLDGHDTSGYARFEVLVDSTLHQPELISAALDAWLLPVDADWWRLADIASGIAHVHSGQQERFTPQLLNYDINNTIDFKKGCYTGQEVVARMYYRAEAKRRLYRGSLAPDQPLAESGINDADVVAEYQHSDGRRDLLAIANTDDSKRPTWLVPVSAEATAPPATDSPTSPPAS